MKKLKLNKSTLLLAFLAVAFWFFYFWQEKENQEFLIETQGLIYTTTSEIINFRNKENNRFTNKAVYSLKDETKDSSVYNKIEKKLYHSIPNSLQDYFGLVSAFENQFIIQKYHDEEYILDDERRTSLRQYSDSLHEFLGVEKSSIYPVDWQQNYNKLWLDLIKQRQQVLDLTDSIFEKNKKQFPTSYVSNNFEGYTTLIPDYQNKIMLIKSYIFFIDTKYGTEYYISTKNNNDRMDINSLLLDSSFHHEENAKTFYSFHKLGDTILYPPFIDKSKAIKFAIPIKIIPKKADYAN